MQVDEVARDESPKVQPDARPPLLVLAEDDDDLRSALGDLLAVDGFEVASVRDGTRLVDLMARCAEGRRMPEVIVTDHRMPGISGIEVLERLRRRGIKVPVIVITAFGEEVGDIARALGANAVFEKPFDPDDLRTAVLCSVHWKIRRKATQRTGWNR